jgi:hypothetical protein
VIAMNQYGNNDFYLHTVLDRLPLAVTQSVPFHLEVEEPKSALVQNGEMTLKFRVVREAGYDGPVTVSVESAAQRRDPGDSDHRFRSRADGGRVPVGRRRGPRSPWANRSHADGGQWR